MKATITNIILEDNHFRVFVRFENGIEETNTFAPENTAEDIKVWVTERKTYFETLKEQETELQSLVGEEI